MTGRRFDPGREQKGRGPVSGRGRVAGRVERGQDPLGASAVAEDDPGPAEPVGDAEREQRVVRDAPGQGGVDVGALGPGEGQVLGLVTAAHACCGESGRVREPGGVCGPGTIGQPGVGHGFERERPDAVEEPVSDRAAAAPGPIRWSRSATHPRRRRSPANGSPAGRPRRSPRPPARRGLRGRTPRRAAVRRRRRWQVPTGRAGRRGTTGRSSIGWST